MSRKISQFFTKKSIKIESIQESERENQNSSNTSAEHPQKLTSRPENQEKIIENVKTEAENQLLVILPKEKIHKFPVPIKIEAQNPQIDKLQCQICDKNFRTVGYFRKHQTIHNKRFRCQACDKRFPIKSQLLSHIENVHENPGRFKCNVCKVGLNTKLSLKRHQRVHIKNRIKHLKCDKCDFATDLRHSMIGHLKRHDRKIKRCDKCDKNLLRNVPHECSLVCKFCDKKFTRRNTVVHHIKKFHTHEIGRSFYDCDICGLKFFRKKFLVNHMDKKHADGKIQIFTCDLDGKTFNLKANLDQHMKIHLPLVKCEFCHIKVNKSYLRGHILKFHTGIKKPKKKYIPKNKKSKTQIFQCPICFKILTTKTTLNYHVKNHNKTLKCKFCGMLFGNQKSFKTHMRNFHERLESECSCKICGKTFGRQTYLKDHMKTHDPNRPRDLKCSQCDFATFNKQSFEIHLNFHKRKNAEIEAMENPHKCPQCPAVKESKKSLKKHIYYVHPKALFDCDICGKTFKTKGCLLPHFRGPHMILP